MRRLGRRRRMRLSAIEHWGPSQSATFQVGLRRGQNCGDAAPKVVTAGSLHECAKWLAESHLGASGLSTFRVIGAWRGRDEPAAQIRVWNEKGWSWPEFVRRAQRMAQDIADTFCQDYVPVTACRSEVVPSGKAGGYAPVCESFAATFERQRAACPVRLAPMDDAEAFVSTYPVPLPEFQPVPRPQVHGPRGQRARLPFLP